MVLKSIFGKKAPNPKSIALEKAVDNVSQKVMPAETPHPGQQNEPPSALFLEQAMMDNARSDNPDTRTKVYQELLFSDLLLSMADGPETNSGDGQTKEAIDNESQPLNVAILTNSQGTPFCAAFTSVAAAKRWRAEGGNYAGVRGQDLFKLLENSPAEVLVINPGNAPFIVLQKVEFKQLALGVIPQTPYSPVQVGVASEDDTSNANQTKIAFPPGVFSEEQKQKTRDILTDIQNVEAAAIGAILPPGADEQTGWIRTIFLRVSGVQENAQEMQKFCMDIRSAICQDSTLFEETPFEVGVMPDPSFWQAMHENKIILFDKNASSSP